MITERAYYFWFECRQELSNNIETLLRDLLWVDGFLHCTRGPWSSSYEEMFRESGSESLALIDFVVRLKNTEAACIKSQQGTPLLQWIADRTPDNALRKQLLQSLSDGDKSR